MVGHDIRNPLQAITSDIYLAKTDMASCPKVKKKRIIESLDEIGKNVEYINKIVSDLQDYARTTSPQMVKIDVNKMIQEILASAKYS